MNNFLITILDITNTSEDFISRISLKILYNFNCVVLTIWGSNQLGENFTDIKLDYISVLNFILSLKIIIPVYVFLFINYSVRTISKVSSIIFGQIVFGPILHYCILSKMRIEEYLKQNNIIDNLNGRGEEYAPFINSLRRYRRIISKNILFTNYYTWFTVTTLAVYLLIAKTIYPMIYFHWINVLLWIFLITALLLNSFAWFADLTLDKFKRKIRTLLKKY